MSEKDKNLDLQSVKNTEENVAQMEKILSLMEEIDALKKNVGSSGKDESGASKDELKRALSDMKKRAKNTNDEDQESSDRLSDEVKALKAQLANLTTAQYNNQPQQPQVPVQQQSFVPQQKSFFSAVESFKAGDNTLLLENIFNSLSDQIEDLKRQMTKQFEYKVMQDSSIYDDMMLEVKRVNPMNAFEVQDIALRIAESMPTRSYLTGGAVSEEIGEIKEMLQKLGGGNDHEFSLLNYEILEFMKTNGEDSLRELLSEAKELKNRASRYIDNGSVEKGNMLIAGLRSRLRTVTLTGSAAVSRLININETLKADLVSSKAELKDIQKEFRKYELESLLPKVDSLNEILTAKKRVFKNADLTVKDKQTIVEISEASEGITEVTELTEESAETLKNLKSEMLGFTIDAVFDYDIVRESEREVAENDMILSEIKALREELKNKSLFVPAGASAAGDAAEMPETPVRVKDILKKPALDLEKATGKKSKRVLRPAAVTSADSKVDKADLPFKVRRNSIQLVKDDPELLANILVDKVAENMAEKYINKR